MLRAEGIWASYGRTEALRDVTIEVDSGQVVALLGPNGAGKTSLLRVVSGLLQPRLGSVTLGGSCIGRLRSSARARSGICLIPEGRGIFPRLSVRENVAMQARGKHVEQALRSTGERFPILAERSRQLAGTLSGGQQQLLALNRALLVEPKVVLADELSLGLAPIAVDQIFDALDAIRARGTALLIVEQYVERALAFADYIYILYKGQIAFEGPPSRARATDVFERYMGSEVADEP